jgi:hypothetical protein
MGYMGYRVLMGYGELEGYVMGGYVMGGYNYIGVIKGVIIHRGLFYIYNYMHMGG